MQTKRLLILIALSICALFIITFSFSFSTSSVLHPSSVNNNNGNGHHDDDDHNKNNKLLLNFLQREQLLVLMHQDGGGRSVTYRKQLFACYDISLTSSSVKIDEHPTSAQVSLDRDCEDFLLKHSSLIIDHHKQGETAGQKKISTSTTSSSMSLLENLYDATHSLIDDENKATNKQKSGIETQMIEFSSIASDSSTSLSSSKSLLTHDRLYTHSKKMKGQAKVNFVNNNGEVDKANTNDKNNNKDDNDRSDRSSYLAVLKAALFKLSSSRSQLGETSGKMMKIEERANDDDDDNHVEQQNLIDSLSKLFQHKFDRNFHLSNRGVSHDEDSYHRGLQFNFIMKLPQLFSTSSSEHEDQKLSLSSVEALKHFFDEREDFFHQLISIFISSSAKNNNDNDNDNDQNNGHQVQNHDINKQRESMTINFIFVGLDDETLVKDVLKIFVQDLHKQEHCRIISSSNKLKSTRSSLDDIVTVTCDRGDEANHDVMKKKISTKLIKNSKTIDPSFFCDDRDVHSRIQLKSSLKFGTKTGVYKGSYSSPSSSTSSSPSQHQNQKRIETTAASVLVKHYNLVQYVHGFSSGLHQFLASPFSFLHPVIVMPMSACAFTMSHRQIQKQQQQQQQPEPDSNFQIIRKESDNYENKNADIFNSLVVTENVFQFQPLISKQMSLTKFLKHQRKIVRKASSSSSPASLISTASSFSSPLTWTDRIDLSLQLLCTFNFLHSHPDGPFSFDDNHPDQYLLVLNSDRGVGLMKQSDGGSHEKKSNKHNNSSSATINFFSSASSSTAPRFLLKMVDIDTLQQAKKKNNKKPNLANEQNDDQVTNNLPPGALPGQTVRDPRMKFHRHVDHDHDDDSTMLRLKHQQTDFTLQCRCFYCRGRSNCIFVNSIEGYRECGQYDAAKERGDEGNKEVFSPKKKTSSSSSTASRGSCTMMTDSWYLGQLLYYIATDGDLLFPTSSFSMKEVIESIEAGLTKASTSSMTLNEIFPHLSSSSSSSSSSERTNKQSKNDIETRIQFMNVVRRLLIDRWTPRGAAEMLIKISSCGDGTCTRFKEKDSWCPMEYQNVHDETAKELFRGLKVAV